MDSQFKITVNTKMYGDGRIEHETKDIHNQIIREVMYTKEEQTKKALIALGWTPPPSDMMEADND